MESKRMHPGSCCKPPLLHWVSEPRRCLEDTILPIHILHFGFSFFMPHNLMHHTWDETYRHIGKINTLHIGEYLRSYAAIAKVCPTSSMDAEKVFGRLILNTKTMSNRKSASNLKCEEAVEHFAQSTEQLRSRDYFAMFLT